MNKRTSGTLERCSEARRAPGGFVAHTLGTASGFCSNVINTLCNGLNPSPASLRLSLCMDTWDEFGLFTADALDRAALLSWKKGGY